MNDRITILVEPRSDGYLAQVFVDGLRVAKQQVATKAEGEKWAAEYAAMLREEVRG